MGNIVLYIILILIMPLFMLYMFIQADWSFS